MTLLPLSTLCIAIGDWDAYTIPFHINAKNMPKCRIFACSSLLDRCIKEFSDYIPKAIIAANSVLGAYPFPRIDFLVVPSTFGSLGMASPNVVFLSQSLVAGDGSFCSRIAHEISHGWFGLSIGALDWTEEWLSEGFATFMEDVLHAKALGMNTTESGNHMELKEFIRKKTLMQEVENTNEELQVLRASQGKVNTDVIDEVNATILKNGQNPLKTFTQVHYIKGYFLLKYLCDIVGINDFLNFLKSYVKKFEGQLVTSKEFLGFFLDSFPKEREILSVERITENWLHNSGINKEIENIIPSQKNQVFQTVIEETQKWKLLNQSMMRTIPKRRKYSMDGFQQLSSEQSILLLENLLEEEAMHSRTLKRLDSVFNFSATNAEVQHRWFELVVKHKYKRKYDSLEKFLLDHLAMGVYLYGELIYSGDTTQKSVARKCFAQKREDMEPNFRKTIDEMFL